MADERIDYEIGVSGDAAIALKEIESRLGALAKESGKTSTAIATLDHSIDEQADSAKRAAGYNKLYERSTRAAGNEALKTTAKVNRMNRAMTGANVAVNKSFGGGGKGGKRGGVGRFVEKSAAVAVGMIAAQFAKFGGMAYIAASVIPSLVTGIGALVAGILALGGSLMPVAGIIVAYPGYLAAVAQGFIAVKLAMAGIGDALKVWGDHTKTIGEVNEGLARFTGGGINKDIAKPFISSLSQIGTQFQYMGYGIQRSLLPGMQEILKTGQKMLPMVSGALSQTGTVIGDVLDKISGYLKTSRAQGLIGAILGNNIGILTSFGTAIEGILGTVLETVNAAGPMLKRMAADIAGFMGELMGKANAGARSGGLGAYFNEAYEAVKRLLGMLGPLLAGLKNVMALGKPLGDALIATWTKLGEKFKAFTQSEVGIARINVWFEQMTPVLYELGYLIADLAKGFAAMAQDSGFLLMVATIRVQLLPLLLEFVGVANQQVFPSLMKITTAALEFMLAIQQSSATALMFSTFGNILEGVNAILNAMNGALLKVIAAIAVVWVTVKMGKFIYFIFDLLRTKILFVMLVFRSFGALVKTTAVEYRVATGSMMVQTSTLGAKISTLKTIWVANWAAMSTAVKSALISTGIGIIVVALGFLVDWIMQSNSAVDEAVAKNKAWAESLFEVDGALSGTSRQLAATRLVEEGYMDQLENLGISSDLAIRAITGEKDAMAELEAQLYGMLKAEDLYYKDPTNAQGWNRQDVYIGESEAISILRDNLIGIGVVAGSTQAKLQESAALTAGPFADAYAKAAAAVERMNLALQELKGLLDDNKSRRAYLNDVAAARKMVKEGIAAANKKGIAFDPRAFFSEKTVKGRGRMDILEKPIDTALGRADTAISRGNIPKAQRILQRSARDTRALFTSLFGEKQGNKLADDILGPTLAKLDEVKNKVRTTAKADAAVVAAEAAKARADAAASTDPRNYPMGGPSLNMDLPDKSKLNLGAPNLGLPAKTETQITFPGLDMNKAKLDSLEAQLARINNTPIKAPVAPKVPHGAAAAGAWAGGPISAGWKGWVGELGPEAFISSTGAMSIIGKDGPEVKQFSSSGYVIPNHELASMTVAAPVRSRTSSSDESVGSPINVTIGDIHQATEFDVVQAVKRGLREAERDRRERG